ncbi:MAG: sugar ABC transporter permease [bacterium]|nr:sugar ABC transporter permease [bacterium]
MRREYKLALLFVAPAMIIMLAVVLYPFLYNIYLSLTNMGLYTFRNPAIQDPIWKNYQDVLGQREMYSVLLKTVVWTGVNVFFHVAIGLFLAVLLNQPIKGRTLFRVLLILPWAMPQYISALTWRGMFNYEWGAVNHLLGFIGIEAIPWSTQPFWAFVAPLITNIWLGFPFMMIIALGGLQSIPKAVYESASVDGAGPIKSFFSITLPMLKPVLAPAIMLGTVWTFNNLNVIWLVSHGGEPSDKTHILVSYVYKAAFQYYRYGYAAAFSMVLFLILFGLVWMQSRAGKATEANW